MKNYLKQVLGKSEALRVWHEMETMLPSMALRLPPYKSRITRKAALKTLPVIAMYQVLKSSGRKDAFDIAYRYEVDVVGEANNRKFKSLEKLPGFFGLYKKVYWTLLHHNDMCDYAFGENTPNSFNFYVTRCLWLDVCTLFGVPELTVAWCHCDTAGFAGMTKLEFRRTCTLAENGKPCDYCFVRKKQVVNLPLV